MKPSSSLLLLFGLLLPVLGWSQRLDDPLTHGADPREVQFYETHSFDAPVTRGETTPPAFDNLRTMAEWEEIEVLCVGWEGYSAIEKQIVVNAAQECNVIILTSYASDVEDYLTSNNNGGPAASLDNITIIDNPMNTVWIRDYGPNTVYGNGVDDRLIVDWIYNRPRPDDDASPQVIADELGIDLYETTAEPYDLMNTGGNFMSDGFGTGFASNLIVDENSGGNTWWGTQYPDQSVEEIEGILADFMGLHTYVRMENLPYDGIHHIDMHMKLLDESTLLVSEYPAGVADGPQIEANLQYVLSNFTTKWGTPFNVIRIPSPPEYGDGYPNQGGDYLTYSNATFVNNTILLPTYYQQYDTTAIRIWEEAMPGYNVVGIDCDSQGEDLIRLSGAIHCITHSVGVADPLMISHLPLSDTEDVDNDRAVRADISHRSGIATATMSWSTGPDGPWTELPMAEVDANDLFATYEASIPALPVGTKVHYFVSAEANSGKSGSRPMPAPEGWWSYKVVGPSLGLDEANATAPWRALYPNPAKAMTCLELNMPKPTACQVTLHNSLGQQVRILHDGVLPQGTQRLFLDASSLASGPYLVTLTTAHGTRWTERLMVQE